MYKLCSIEYKIKYLLRDKAYVKLNIS